MYCITTIINVSGSVHSQYIQHYVRIISVSLNILKCFIGCLQIFIENSIKYKVLKLSL
jgi:hypothetical protein